MGADGHRFAAADIERFIAAAYMALGVPQSDAASVAGLMVEADLTGYDSHGTFRLRQYVNRLRDGGTNARANVTIAQEHGATAIVDGDNGLGHLAMRFAARLAMGVDAIVIRDAAAGAAALIADHVHCSVVNGGDGCHEHPTQGLLDVFALRERIGTLSGKVVAIVGDVNGSRVARSAAHGLTTLGADVLMVGPATLVPQVLEALVVPESQGGTAVGTVRVAHDLDEILPDVDAIMMLRVQLERVLLGVVRR